MSRQDDLKSNTAEKSEEGGAGTATRYESHEDSRKLIVAHAGVSDIASTAFSGFRMPQEGLHGSDVLSVGAANQSLASQTIAAKDFLQGQRISGSPPPMAASESSLNSATNVFQIPEASINRTSIPAHVELSSTVLPDGTLTNVSVSADNPTDMSMADYGPIGARSQECPDFLATPVTFAALSSTPPSTSSSPNFCSQRGPTPTKHSHFEGPSEQTAVAVPDWKTQYDEVASQERQLPAAAEPRQTCVAESVHSKPGYKTADQGGASCAISQYRADLPSAKALPGSVLPPNDEIPNTDLGTAPDGPMVEPTPPEDLTTTPRFPLATLIVILLQVQSHLNFLHNSYPERCASVATILRDGRWERLATAAFHHGDVVHITANIASFFFKGLVIEAALGTKYFVAVLTVVVVLVGAVNASLLQVLYAVTGASFLETTCMHTFAGVALALELLHREYFCGSIIHLGKLVFRVRPLACVLLELLILYSSSARSFLPMVSGLLVGLLLAETLAVSQIIRWGFSFYNEAVTCVFIACACVIHASGPYPVLQAADQNAWTFKHSIWHPFVLPSVYVANACHLAYVLLSLLAVGQKLERNMGHYRFLVMFLGLLLVLTVLQHNVPAFVWKHVLLREDPLPDLLGQPGNDCGCALFCTVLAMKAVQYRGLPRSRYEMASIPVHVPFWPGLVLELTLLHLQTGRGSSFGHVVGVLLGLAVARFGWKELSCPVQDGRSTSTLGGRAGSSDSPKRGHHDLRYRLS
ncbi:hypothetical protein HPB50_003855 [Hyalomma asiaticum]|uniref:Uncharacterized protein n=1 Tax=Hyalomma asiaticum TaxID=266040 RepID=A0ACB7RMB3_HYAAI|nr:hypothetical protein HPB50_003855 [Hyalomma asiaticum]